MTGRLIDIIDCLEKGGFGHMKLQTIKVLLVFYHLGPMVKSELVKITGRTEAYIGNALNDLWRMGILDKKATDQHRKRYEYKLHKSVRLLIDDSKAGLYSELD